jgi:hypothetical protein
MSNKLEVQVVLPPHVDAAPAVRDENGMSAGDRKVLGVYQEAVFKSLSSQECVDFENYTIAANFEVVKSWAYALYCLLAVILPSIFGVYVAQPQSLANDINLFFGDPNGVNFECLQKKDLNSLKRMRDNLVQLEKQLKTQDPNAVLTPAINNLSHFVAQREPASEAPASQEKSREEIRTETRAMKLALKAAGRDAELPWQNVGYVEVSKLLEPAAAPAVSEVELPMQAPIVVLTEAQMKKLEREKARERLNQQVAIAAEVVPQPPSQTDAQLDALRDQAMGIGRVEEPVAAVVVVASVEQVPQEPVAAVQDPKSMSLAERTQWAREQRRLQAASL